MEEKMQRGREHLKLMDFKNHTLENQILKLNNDLHDDRVQISNSSIDAQKYKEQADLLHS